MDRQRLHNRGTGRRVASHSRCHEWQDESVGVAVAVVNEVDEVAAAGAAAGAAAALLRWLPVPVLLTDPAPAGPAVSAPLYTARSSAQSSAQSSAKYSAQFSAAVDVPVAVYPAVLFVKFVTLWCILLKYFVCVRMLV